MSPLDRPADHPPKPRPLATEVLAAARSILPWMVEIRRDLHQHPELGLEEHRTAARVQSILDDLGIEHRDGIGGTGVLGLVHDGGAAHRAGPAVALRADLDALPMHDAKDVPYRSTVDGRMHACGHDVHTTVLLGAARLLAEQVRRPPAEGGGLPGLVKLLFQPAEETVGGAEILIEAGALAGPPVEAIFGLHAEPTLDVGRVGIRYGQRNASSDAIVLSIVGNSAHGAYPANGVDAIVVAAQVVSALQTLVSRNVDARKSAVLTFGTIHGGTQRNIISNRVELTGTLRTLEPETRELMKRRLRETAEGVATAMGARAELEIERGYDALINDDAMVDLVRDNAVELIGEGKVIEIPLPSLGVEDFAYYLHEAPGAFYSLGVRNADRGIVYPLHHERFDVDEECLVYGAALQFMNALAVLRRHRREGTER